MSKDDSYYPTVRAALQADGWTIVEDPLRLKIGKQFFQIDLACRKNKEGENEEIAVEIKSFLQESFITEFYHVRGQYLTYRDALDLSEYAHLKLYLALPEDIYTRHWTNPFIDSIRLKDKISLLLCNDKQQITQWL
ncbi:element excision factor XisH family protein [Cytophagaceae bacterium DM2B3-1]|uniref:Element excision factor XisH family protein n=1 Tax=Xanthocytophaga flava TaxID=3048013 RepID=A0ABT7CYH9_9BACT|nr:element excision factor XisH family protein [Xanthocytophaga flavus]MDJ1498808.1 element excision factor XisH family protein [Xanthocytophaga flavus]